MSMELTIDSEPLERAIAMGPRTLAKHLDRAIGRSIHEMARSAKGHAPKANSELTNAINAVQPNALEGLVVVGVDYGQAVEEGTGAYGPEGRPSGKVPPEVHIEDWIRVKHITPDDPNMDAEDLAFVIARSIAARGTPAQPYMQPAYDENVDKAQRRIDAAIDAAIEEMGA